jgi:hypothetical protein
MKRTSTTRENSASQRQRAEKQAAEEQDAIIERVRELFAELIELIKDHPDAGAVLQFIADHHIELLLPIYRDSLQAGDWTPLHAVAAKTIDHVNALLSIPGFCPLVNWHSDGGESPLDVAIQHYSEPEEGEQDYGLPCIMALLREGATDDSPFEHDSVHPNVKKVLRAHRQFFNMVEAAEPNMEVLNATLAEYPFLATCKKDGVPVLEYARQTGACSLLCASLAR